MQYRKLEFPVIKLLNKVGMGTNKGKSGKEPDKKGMERPRRTSKICMRRCKDTVSLL